MIEENKRLRARVLELESLLSEDEPIVVDVTESAEESEEEMPAIDAIGKRCDYLRSSLSGRLSLQALETWRTRNAVS